MLCLLREHVYYSITETLIRRSLFSRIGCFQSRWGSVSDFHWHMRVGLVADVVHVPDTWATWRIHPHQATAYAIADKSEYDRQLEEMIDDAWRCCAPHLTAQVVADLESHWLRWTREMMEYYRNLLDRPDAMHRRLYQLSCALNGASVPRWEIARRLTGRPKWPDIAPMEIQGWLESRGSGPVLEGHS